MFEKVCIRYMEYLLVRMVMYLIGIIGAACIDMYLSDAVFIAFVLIEAIRFGAFYTVMKARIKQLESHITK